MEVLPSRESLVELPRPVPQAKSVRKTLIIEGETPFSAVVLTKGRLSKFLLLAADSLSAHSFMSVRTDAGYVLS